MHQFFGKCSGSIAIFAAVLWTGGAAANAAAPPIDGIHCDQMEHAAFHIHEHLALFDHGKPVTVPGNVGRPTIPVCFYWVHTHTPDGLIHVEAPISSTFTLGNFFDIWGQPLSATAVGPARIQPGQLRTFVDGRPYAGDPRTIKFVPHTDIVLEAGPPYAPPVPFTAWKGQ